MSKEQDSGSFINEVDFLLRHDWYKSFEVSLPIEVAKRICEMVLDEKGAQMVDEIGRRLVIIRSPRGDEGETIYDFLKSKFKTVRHRENQAILNLNYREVYALALMSLDVSPSSSDIIHRTPVPPTSRADMPALRGTRWRNVVPDIVTLVDAFKEVGGHDEVGLSESFRRLTKKLKRLQ